MIYIGDALLILHSYELDRSSRLNRYAFSLVHEQENAEGAGGNRAQGAHTEKPVFSKSSGYLTMYLKHDLVSFS